MLGMLRRDNIQYHTLWVRVLCCVSWGVALMNAAHFQVLSTLDIMCLEVFTTGEPRVSLPPFDYVEPAIIVAYCLASAVPLLDRPLQMIVFGACLLFVQLMGTALLYLATNVLLPLASPVLAVFGSMVILQTMAWSEERIRRDRMERLEQARVQFTDMLVHDLKKRLSSVLTSVSLLEKQSPAGGPDKDLMVTLRSSAARMLLEINNLLDIRKIEERGMSLKPEAMPLDPLLTEALAEHDSAARLAEIRFRRHGDAGFSLSADRHILSRVFTNLLWNAIQHAPAGTEVDIAVRRENGDAVISVANRGDPIPPFRLKRLFLPFLSDLDPDPQRLDGTGLGLAFCKLAMEAHGGVIQVESPWSDASDGVRIILRLPLNPGVAAAPHAVAALPH
jgi:signal transduction histidine kinase